MMKLDNKTINIAAGVIFLLRALSTVTNSFSQMAAGIPFYLNPIRLIMTLYGIIVLAIMGIQALRQKKRGKALNSLGYVYLGYVIFNLFSAFPHSLNVRALVSLALLIAAFVLTQKASGGAVFDTKDTASEAAKVQIQAQKQTTIYDEQLKDGILTQEEYDQIMKNKQ